MNKLFLIILLISIITFLSSDTNFRLMSYNALNFDGTDRLTEFETVLTVAAPDILICQEIKTESASDDMLNILNNSIGGYARADFVYDGDLNNMLFYKTSIATLNSQDEIDTSPRDVSEYVMNIDGNPIRFYSCHLKASTGYETERLAAVTILRDHLNGLTEGTEFIIVGDMNFYTSSESGYQKFIDSEVVDIGRAEDLCSQVGSWHDSGTYADVHTQSTRVENFGYGATGGLDDKFDFIFGNYGLNNGSGIEYNSGSFTAYGNDGNHFNQSINAGTNTAVPANVADALYYASDHLPVFGDFTSVSGGTPPSGSLIISEYIEGSSFNKAIEIYNGTGATVNLSEYSLEKDVNGDNSWGNSYNYSGSLADSEAFVLVNSQATQTILDEADATDNGVINFNGNDQVRLLKYGTEIDRIGISGDITFAANVTYVRNSNITEPQSGEQDPRSNGEWTSYASDTFTYLGSHTQDTPANQAPQISNIQHTPTSPNSFQTVSISADITDSDGTISSSALNWGLTSGNITNSINMSHSAGNTYTSDTQIPTQTNGTTVYYFLEATDDDNDTTTSSTYSYTVSADSNQHTIYEIQGQTSISPFNEQIVTTSGIVTATYANGYFLQDGEGAWNGILVYDSSNLPAIGDDITVEGEVYEYYDLTEIRTITSYMLNSSGNQLPNATVLTTLAVGIEDYESVLIEIQNAECTELLTYNEWHANDGSGNVRINDLLYDADPEIGTFYNIVGILNYNYSNFKIEPRNENDVTEIIQQPAAPQNVTIEIAGSEVLLQWDAVSGAAKYHVWRSADPYSNFVRITPHPEGITGNSYTDTLGSDKYFYYITAE